ncbi:hypothetical protein [Archaeoglobus sp.]
MYLDLREKLAENLRKAGYRVISPFKVLVGWVDIAILRKRVGIDLYAGSYESCIERLTSHPFREIYVVGDCDGCIPIEEFCESFNIEIPCESFEELENPSMHVKAIEDSLAYLYTVGEVYEKNIDYKPLKVAIADLKMLGFSSSFSKPKLKPEMFACLTHEGYAAAKKVVGRRVKRNEKKLKKIAEDPKSYIIALGISESLAVRSAFDKPEDYSLKSLLNFMKKFPLEECRFTESAHPKTVLCQFLANSILNEEAVKLAKKLNNMGLAFKLKSYSPYGYEMGEEYRITKEAVEAILKFSYTEIPKDVIGEFLAATYPLTHTDIYPILNQAGQHLLNAEKAGFCRISGTKITIGEKFVEYARVRLAMIMERVIEGLS